MIKEMTSLVVPFFFSAWCTAADLEKLNGSDWIKAATPHFEIVTDADEETTRFILNDLESFRHFTINMMGLQVIEGLPPLKVLAVERRKNFNYLDLPDTWAGAFQMSVDG